MYHNTIDITDMRKDLHVEFDRLNQLNHADTSFNVSTTNDERTILQLFRYIGWGE